MLWRREFLLLRRLGGWLLVYGRRKTGKSFMARLLVPWRLYVTVSRDLAAIVEAHGRGPEVVELGDAVAAAARVLDEGGAVVVDEFQRLPERYWQLLATRHPAGRLVLVASSLGVLRRVLDARSPLLGLVQPLRVDPISYGDTVASLLPRLGSRAAVLWGLLLREPWLLPMLEEPLGEPWRFIARRAYMLAQAVRGLVGEVFEEEERQLTRLYEAVLRLLGAGVWSSSRLAGILHRRGLLSTASPGPVAGLLDRMTEMGLVVKTRLWRTRGARIYYRHASPLLAIVYGLAERYGVDEAAPVDSGLLEEAARHLYARELQFAIGELLAEHHGGVHAYTILPNGSGDVDVVVLDKRGRRPLAAYEVKLGMCSREDLRMAAERAELVGAPHTGAVCLGGVEAEYPGVEVVGPEKLAAIAVQNAGRAAKGHHTT